MTRNMIKRVEILFPIFDTTIKQRIMDAVNTELEDNMKARVQDANGVYHYKEQRGQKAVDSQNVFLKQAYRVLNDEE